jgi:hypothetical protein
VTYVQRLSFGGSVAEGKAQDLASRAFELSLICENILINPRHHSSIVYFQKKEKLALFSASNMGFITVALGCLFSAIYSKNSLVVTSLNVKSYT